MTKISTIPLFGDRGTHVEILQNKLLTLGYPIGNADGDFGNKTKDAIKQFQALKGLTSNGVMDSKTLSELDLEEQTKIDADPITAIMSIVDNERITKTFWENGDRGLAPYGYYYGMALMYARLYKRLKNNDVIAVEISKPLTPNEKTDSLYKYDDVFVANDMSNSTSTERLKNLFVLMFGLGLMESNGKYCCGWDRGKLDGWGDPAKKIDPTAENSEAGLFQTSYDILLPTNKAYKIMLSQVFNNYKQNPDGFLPYFSKGAKCKEINIENFGDGAGKEFQRLSKECPGFVVELTAVALRNISNHWNPVIKKGDAEKGLQIKKACNALLQKVKDYIDDNSGIGSVDQQGRFTSEGKISATAKAATNLKETALNLAGDIGQKEQLKRLFKFAPASNANYWAVVDFNKPSSENRLFIFDLKGGHFKSYLVAHGKNSGDKYADKFSNEVGSNKSSLGIYKTLDVYDGAHGRSLHLDGLEASNSNVKARFIVIHKADYVVPNYENTGRAGRSEGCLAINPLNIDEVINCLQGGSYILAWHK